ncbi:hypothetical protein BOTBODRAFT_172600 [Botryobasidium botryosum FD-172 SS1]|uniref:SUI1 domain-containing protein n=1 Tax=Botryobasidium botryosum (strain FD-172 SS1) TaxID=930990 RepID=A0A067MQJ7_BOTB1|nr:hypothetical protein BOTBODRAFT_172600 [Botryobasidium botryosum FD-172 SS1]
MFKRPLQEKKTSSPIRASQWRQLKAQIASESAPAGCIPEDIDALVPDRLLSAKFTTYQAESGVMYTSQDKDPLWITLRDEPDKYIPTVPNIHLVYTLWKRPVLPIITTPSAVISKLIGGADLMAPGVIGVGDDEFPSLARGALVAIAPYGSEAPLAVGRMALSSTELNEDSKGKAVYIIHTFQDALWELGSKSNPPQTIIPFTRALEQGEETTSVDALVTEETQAAGAHAGFSIETTPTPGEPTTEPGAELVESQSDLTPAEVDTVLRKALLQAIPRLSKLPPGTFPIPASNFYSSHILPSRPARCPPSCDIKKSSFKKVSKFLQAAEKDGLLKLKEMKGDLNVMGVVATHGEVVGHRSYKTMRDAEASASKAAEAAATEASKAKPLVVKELHKPHGSSVAFFKTIGNPPDELYAGSDLRTILEDYIHAHSLVCEQDKKYIRPDENLSFLFAKNETSEFLPRSELVERLVGTMQHWHSVVADGRDPVLKKGKLSPISIVIKLRQGKRASTLITDFEAFLLTADFLCAELQKSCASSTSSAPVKGKPNAIEVLVQGKHAKAVTDLLISQGVPKHFITFEDLTDKKKKK